MCCLQTSYKFNQLLQQTTKAFRLLPGNPQFRESCFAPNKNKTALLTEKKIEIATQFSGTNFKDIILQRNFRSVPTPQRFPKVTLGVS